MNASTILAGGFLAVLAAGGCGTGGDWDDRPYSNDYPGPSGGYPLDAPRSGEVKEGPAGWGGVHRHERTPGAPGLTTVQPPPPGAPAVTPGATPAATPGTSSGPPPGSGTTPGNPPGTGTDAQPRSGGGT